MATHPVSIAVIGWTYFALGALMFLLGGVVLLSLGFLRGAEMAPDPMIAPELAALMDKAPEVLTLIGPACWVTIILGAAIGWASIAFLRLQKWARPAIEVITWLGVLHNIWLGLAVWRALERLASYPEFTALISATALRTAGLISAFAIAVLFTLPLLSMVRSLRSATVRHLFSTGRGTANDGARDGNFS